MASSFTCKSHPYKLLKKHNKEIEELFNCLVKFYRISFTEEISKLFEYLIEYHDLGKCRKEFQDYIKCLEEGKRCKSPGSHSLWSLGGIYGRNIRLGLSKKYLFILYYLISKHHSNLTDNIRNEKILANLILRYFGISGRDDFLNLMERYPIDREEIKYLFLEVFVGKRVKSYFKNYIFSKLSKEEAITIADLFGLFKIADTLSAQNAVNKINEITYREEVTEERVRELIENIDEKRWEIQRELSKYNYLFLRAPTGWGKTTTALLFATNKDYNKIFIILPTITAIEKFYSKLKSKFKVEMYFYLYDAYLTYEKELNDKIRDLFYIRNLYTPINITTIDQILLSFLQAGKYFLKRVNLRNSILILDEVHLLTPQMLFLLRKFVEHMISLYKIKLLFMSATLPRGIVEYLTENSELDFETIDIYGLIDRRHGQKEYYNRERIEFELFRKDLLEDLDKIVEENKKGKSILVILNTVEKAIAVYKKLKEEFRVDNILLLHGRLMYKDRRDREREIKNIERKKGIFVATQVAEVSLDIDFDILFTELASISSLIQRAGRVNRRGNKGQAKVYVYYPSEIEAIEKDRGKRYPYEITEMKKTWSFLEDLNNFKEGEVAKQVDEMFTRDFYENLIKKDGICKKYREVFESKTDFSVYWFLSSISEEKGKELLEFRESITTLIIPFGDIIEANLHDEINDLLNNYKTLKEKNAGYAEWERFFGKVKQYAVPAPIWLISMLAREEELEKMCAFPVIENLPEKYKYMYFREYGFVNLDKLEEFGVNLLSMSII